MNLKAQTLLDALDCLDDGAVVVEIGCARFAHEIPSDGWSTVHLATAAGEAGWTLHSVDIDPSAVRVATAATDGLSVTLHNADGAAWLRRFRGTIDALYLDGSANPAEALAQYEAAKLADTAVVAIDDVQLLEGFEHGKGDLLLDRLDADGFVVEVNDTEPGYRMAVAHRTSR